MYNQFTAVDQKPLPLGKIILDPMGLPKAGRKKKKKIHSKNPYKIKRIRILGEEDMAEKVVDGLVLLKMLRFEHPKEIVTANISFKRIVDINADHLEYFSNLIELNCSENYIAFQKLRKLPAVEKINIAHNQIQHVKLEEGGFNCLQHLDMSFNTLHFGDIPHLSLIPCLMQLDLGYNQLSELPNSLEHFSLLKKLNLEGNNFKSDEKASNFWASLATLPCVEVISIARNQIRGIHTEKLTAGNFFTLAQLDFSYNIVENQHNLICARNFVNLKKLFITGNPFALGNEFKGLEMQVYARTGAEVIIEHTNLHYLKPKKAAKPTIRFDRFVKVETDTFLKKKNALFGIDLTKQDDLFSSDTEEQQSEGKEEDSQGEEPMFVTEQVPQNQKDKPKKKKLLQAKVEEEDEEDHNEPEKQKSNVGSQSSHSRSIEYGQFHKIAAELLGGEKEYKKSFDIHTSYKALKKAMERAKE